MKIHNDISISANEVAGGTSWRFWHIHCCLTLAVSPNASDLKLAISSIGLLNNLFGSSPRRAHPSFSSNYNVENFVFDQ